MITVSECVSTIRPTLKPSLQATWGRYLDLLTECMGSRELSEVTATDVVAYAARAQETALSRRGSTGRSAQDHAVAAARRLLRRAVIDGLVSRHVGPAIPKPRRVENNRTARTTAR